MTKVLLDSFQNDYGGMSVIIAPPGSGKSTYLRNYSNLFLNKDGHVKLLSSETVTRGQFFEAFGASERACDLFDIMPNNSVIVWDQMEKSGTLNNEMKGLLGHLAVESRRVSGKNVVISTSTVENAREILSLNGNDKIRQAGQCSNFMWGVTEVNNFIDRSPFSKWSKTDQNRLREHAIIAACPGFLYAIADSCSIGGYPEDDKIFSQRAENYRETWNEFISAGF